VWERERERESQETLWWSLEHRLNSWHRSSNTSLTSFLYEQVSSTWQPFHRWLLGPAASRRLQHCQRNVFYHLCDHTHVIHGLKNATVLTHAHSSIESDKDCDEMTVCSLWNISTESQLCAVCPRPRQPTDICRGFTFSRLSTLHSSLKLVTKHATVKRSTPTVSGTGKSSHCSDVKSSSPPFSQQPTIRSSSNETEVRWKSILVRRTHCLELSILRSPKTIGY